MRLVAAIAHGRRRGISAVMSHNYATAKALRAGDALARLTGGTYFSSTGTLTTVAANTARFDHDPSASNASLGLLIEPDLYGFSNNRNPASWNNNYNITTTPSSGTGMDGTNSLIRIDKTVDFGAASHGFLTSRYAPALTISAYVKLGNFDTVYLQLENTSFVSVVSAQFNISNGTVVGGTAGSTIAAMGNGIYRITLPAANIDFKWGYVRLGLNNSNPSGYFLFDGLQVDVGTRPSSLFTGQRRPDVLDITLPTGSYDLLIRYPTGGDWLLNRQAVNNSYRVTLREEKRHLSEITAWTAGALSQAQRDAIYVSDAVAKTQVPAFSDEFTTLSLDTAENGVNTWVTRFVGWNTHRTAGNNDLCFKTHSGFVGAGSVALGLTLHEIVGGNLRLHGMLTPANRTGNTTEGGTSYPYVGGMISSELKHAQQYGYWECRAKFAVTKSQHWSMYLLSSDEQWPPEIDMVEIAGWETLGDTPTGSTLVTMNFHDVAGKVPTDNQQIFAPAAGPGQFHTYGFYWDAHDMIWYFDGVEKLRCATFIHKPMYFLITPEIGSDWPGAPNGTTVWPTTAEIEYVRVSKLAPAV